MSAAVPPTGRRLVVIYNPAKLADEQEFGGLLRDAAARHGWAAPILKPTTRTETGRGLVAEALAGRAELVLAAGGDGTVRQVSTALRNSGVPCGIIPIGTANLLAQNMRIPLDVEQAIDLALTGRPRTLDLARLKVDRNREVYFTGMAGIGFDAALMSDTDEKLKRIVGPAAYLVGFAKQLGTAPRRITVVVDDRLRIRRRAVLILVGNTGSLNRGIRLFPDAKPDDGRLDLLMAAPRSLGAWARLLRVVLRRIRRSSAVTYYAGRRFEITLAADTAWELDGDTEGRGRHFEFEVAAGALLLITPDDQRT